MFYDDDIDVFFDEFAVDITYNGSPSKGIFTAAGTLVNVGKIGYITAENELIVKSSDCSSVKKTDSIVIGGTTYHPFQPQADGTGITKMYLATNVR